MKPGIHPGLPMAEYLGAPAVSGSLLQAIVDECPRAAWHKSWLNPKRVREQSTKAQNAGTVAHAILLEGSRSCVEIIDPRDHPAKTKPFNIPEGWKNDSIRAARDAAIAAGKVPVLPSEMSVIDAMVTEAHIFLESIREREPAIYAAMQPGGGESETTFVWDDDGVLCRMRPDRISVDRDVIVDYKTGLTSAEPDVWGRTQLTRMGFYFGASFYQRGIQAICGRSPDYTFFVQEQEAPYLCSLVGLTPEWRDLGDRKVTRGLGLWKKCAASDSWPGYPSRVCYPDLPPWETARLEAQEMADPFGIPYDVGKLWTKPEKEAA